MFRLDTQYLRLWMRPKHRLFSQLYHCHFWFDLRSNEHSLPITKSLQQQ